MKNFYCVLVFYLFVLCDVYAIYLMNVPFEVMQTKHDNITLYFSGTENEYIIHDIQGNVMNYDSKRNEYSYVKIDGNAISITSAKNHYKS